MISQPQVAPSQFSFDMPNIMKSTKYKNKEKDKWVDKKPFFGGFNKQTNNMQSSKNRQETQDQNDNNAIRAGGYKPQSRQNQRKKYMNNSK